MFVAEPTWTRLSAVLLEYGGRRGVSRFLGSLAAKRKRHLALLAWSRSLPRPPGWAWLPGRVWRRRSALILSCRGISMEPEE